jgi:hypothetical protein
MRRLRRAGSHVANTASATASAHSIEISGLQLAPQTPRWFAVAHPSHQTADAVVEYATAVGMALVARAVQNVVLSLLDALRTEQVVQLMAAGVLVRPLPNCAEHVAVDLNALVADGGMVECTQNIIADLVHRNIGVLPSIKYATRRHC